MPLSTKVIRVPVKLVDGGWELLYGGAVKVKEGAIGKLHLDQTYLLSCRVMNEHYGQIWRAAFGEIAPVVGCVDDRPQGTMIQ